MRSWCSFLRLRDVVVIYGGSVSEAEEDEEGEEEELDVVTVGVGGGGGDFWRVCERLMARRAQCGVVIEGHVSRLILLVAHQRGGGPPSARKSCSWGRSDVIGGILRSRRCRLSAF